MSEPQTPRDVFTEILDRMRTGRFAEAAELYSDDFRLWLPFMLPEPVTINGHADHRENMAPRMVTAEGKPPRLYDNLEIRDFVIHETTDPTVIVAEWVYVSTIGDREIANPNIVVMQVLDGKVAWTRDYHNHVTRAQADGELPAYLELIESMILPEDRG